MMNDQSKIYEYDEKNFQVIVVLMTLIVMTAPVSAITKSCAVKQGILIEQNGKLAITESTNHANIILKLEQPQFHSNKCGANHTYNLLKEDYFKQMNRTAELLHELKFTAPTPSSPRKITKRNILAAFGIGTLIASAVGMGLEELQINKIKHHLQVTSLEVEQVKSKLEKEISSSIVFQDTTIGVFKSLEHQLENIACTMENSRFYTLDKSNIDEYFNQLQIFSDIALQGKLHSTLTPNIINYDTLKEIVLKHPSLKDSVFRSQPAYMYGLSTITLIDIDIHKSAIHLIVEFPDVKATALNPLYTVGQTGLSLGENEDCLYFRTPRNFFTSSNKAYQIHINDDCRTHRNLTVCKTMQHLLKPSCMNTTHMNCEQESRECESTFKFFYTSEGLMVRDNTLNTYYTELSGSIRKSLFNEHALALISWDNIKTIFIAQEFLVENPKYFVTTDIVKYNVELLPPHSKITIRDIEKAYNDYYQKKGEMLSDTLDNYGHHSLPIIALTVSIGTLLLTVAVLAYLTRQYFYKSHYNTLTPNIQDRFPQREKVYLPKSERRNSL